jgi:hypothetical protein
MKLNFLVSTLEVTRTNIQKGKQISPYVQLPCRTHSSAFNSQEVVVLCPYPEFSENLLGLPALSSLVLSPRALSAFHEH